MFLHKSLKWLINSIFKVLRSSGLMKEISTNSVTIRKSKTKKLSQKAKKQKKSKKKAKSKKFSDAYGIRTDFLH